MKPSEIPESVNPELVEAIKREVQLEELICSQYEHLWHELMAQKRRHEGRSMRISSPFGLPGNRDLVILVNRESDEHEWYWADPLAPSSIPRNVIGFVMVLERCGYEVAVERLAAQLVELREDYAIIRESELTWRKHQVREQVKKATGMRRQHSDLGSKHLWKLRRK